MSQKVPAAGEVAKDEEKQKAPLLDPPSFEEVKAEEMTDWILNKFEPYILGLTENKKLTDNQTKEVEDLWGGDKVKVKGQIDGEGCLTGKGVHTNKNGQEIEAYWYKDRMYGRCHLRGLNMMASVFEVFNNKLNGKCTLRQASDRHVNFVYRNHEDISYKPIEKQDAYFNLDSGEYKKGNAENWKDYASLKKGFEWNE